MDVYRPYCYDTRSSRYYDYANDWGNGCISTADTSGFLTNGTSGSGSLDVERWLSELVS